MRLRSLTIPCVPCLGAALLASPCSGPSSVPVEDPDSYSVVVCGHLYSLYVHNKVEEREDVLKWEAPLEAFVEEVREIGPEAVFFLGDNTRFSADFEWEFLEEKLAPIEAKKIFVAGNHDHRDISAFERFGGVRNDSFVIGRNKYVTLDAKSVLEDEDLAFLDRELADHEEYDHVFLMQHFLLPVYDAPPPDEVITDPYAAYTGHSNWNVDVVPRIAGKVSHVFTGDYFDHHVQRAVQRYGEEEIQYVSNSFLFGRGRGRYTTGDGPMLFLELVFRGDDFEIIPHAVPLDVRDPWYLDYRRLGLIPPIDGEKLSWYELDGWSFRMGFPWYWLVSVEDDELYARSAQFPAREDIFVTVEPTTDLEAARHEFHKKWRPRTGDDQVEEEGTFLIKGHENHYRITNKDDGSRLLEVGCLLEVGEQAFTLYLKSGVVEDRLKYMRWLLARVRTWEQGSNGGAEYRDAQEETPR